ncbi:MAG: alpha/beta hydrolase [Pseudoxanthomonas sp.]
MPTASPLDPELRSVVDLMQLPPLGAETLAARRAAYAQQIEALLSSFPEVPGIAFHEARAPGNPDTRVLVFRPDVSPQTLPALLWIHGGGYVDGCADFDRMIAETLAREVGCCVVCVDYRLAPEAPYPAAIDDCHSALAWMHANSDALAIDHRRIAIGGISAGAGLAAALALMARDRGELDVCFQALLQPMLDDRHATDDYSHPYAGEFVWTARDNHFGWSALLGCEPGGASVPAYAAAARATSLAGLPPAFITVGALDLFVEEDMEYARRLIRDGVPTELHVQPSACHGFPFLAPASSVAQAHNALFIAALRRALHDTPQMQNEDGKANQ